MIEEIDKALKTYSSKWEDLVSRRVNKEFFQSLKPTAVGWKVTDKAEYDRLYLELHDLCDMIIEKWMNQRWIAKMYLRDNKLTGGISIIKLMQRRPNSTDSAGLDHVDFFASDASQMEAVLKQEVDLQWTHETNDVVEGYSWISVWFAGTEAKLRNDTVIDVIGAELEEINHKILTKA